MPCEGARVTDERWPHLERVGRTSTHRARILECDSGSGGATAVAASVAATALATAVAASVAATALATVVAATAADAAVAAAASLYER